MGLDEQVLAEALTAVLEAAQDEMGNTSAFRRVVAHRDELRIRQVGSPLRLHEHSFECVCLECQGKPQEPA